MSVLDTVLAAVEAKGRGPVKLVGGEHTFHCPASGHADVHSSCSAREMEDGKVVLICHSRNCPFESMAEGLGLTKQEFFPPKAEAPKRKGRGPLVAEYLYQTIHGKLAYKSCRYQFPGSKDKTFLLFRPDGKGGWIANLEGAERIPYRRPELTAADLAETIYILEGEKCVDLAREKLGIVATTSCGGHGQRNQWKLPAFGKDVKGRNVVCLPDNDAPGEEYAATVAASIVGAAKSIKIVRLPGLPQKGDLEQWLEAGGARDQLLALVEAAPVYDPNATEPVLAAEEPAEPEEPKTSDAVVVPARIADAALDLWSRPNPPALATPWAPLNDLLGGGLRGLNALIAPSGVGKTSLAMTLAIHASATVSVLYVSTELGVKQAIARIAGQVLKQPWRVLWEGSDITGKAVASATAALNIRCLEFRDCGELFAVANAIAASEGQPPFLILDYLQGAAREPGIDRRLAVSGVSNSVLQWCRATGAVALMVSSTARVSYKADDQTGRDLVGTAKESGDVEYDCGSVLYAKMESCPLGGTAGGEIHVGKSRFGTVGWVQVTFHGPTGTFGLDTTGLDVLERKVLAAIRAGLRSGSAIAKAVHKQKKSVLEALEMLRERGFIDSENGILAAAPEALDAAPQLPRQNGQNAANLTGTGSASGSGSGTVLDFPTVTNREPLHSRAAVDGTGSHPPKGGTGNRLGNQAEDVSYLEADFNGEDAI